MEHTDGRRRGHMAVRRPCVERPKPGQHTAADQEQREDDLLEVRIVLDGVEVRQIERADARLHEHRKDADEDQNAGADEHHHELEGAVFFGANERRESARRSPDADQQVHRQHSQFVEEEPEEEIERYEHAEDARHEHEEEDEVILVAVIDLPRNECAGERDDAGQKYHRRADAVDGKVERDPLVAQEANVLDPGPLQLELICLARRDLIGEEGVCGQPEQREACRDSNVAHQVRLLRWHHEQRRRDEKRHGDSGEQHVSCLHSLSLQ